MSAAEHFDVFKETYDRFPCANSGEEFRVAWAERVAGNPLLQAMYASGGPVWPYPFAAEDYTEDRKPGGSV